MPLTAVTFKPDILTSSEHNMRGATPAKQASFKSLTTSYESVRRRTVGVGLRMPQKTEKTLQAGVTTVDPSTEQALRARKGDPICCKANTISPVPIAAWRQEAAKKQQS